GVRDAIIDVVVGYLDAELAGRLAQELFLLDRLQSAAGQVTEGARLVYLPGFDLRFHAALEEGDIELAAADGEHVFMQRLELRLVVSIADDCEGEDNDGADA